MFVVAGGGTGGHLYPGIAIAQEIERRRPGVTIVVAGVGSPLERDIVERHGYRLLSIPSGGVVGKSFVKRIRGAALAGSGFLVSLWRLHGMKPQAVIGVGGYASGPMVMAAVMLRIPTLIQEQNYYPGLTNRLLASWVNRVAVSFAETRNYLGGRGEVTGNPVRGDLRAVAGRAREGRFRVLVFGGSQGAHAINGAVVNALPHLESQRGDLVFRHGAGPADAELLREAYAAGGFEATVEPYITAMREAYAQADLVIARAGASTVSEIAACAKASILVPLPTVAHDHQRFNARALAEDGAAILLEQEGLTGETLARAILDLVRHPERLDVMERAAAARARPEAAARIVDLIEEIVA
jgi:UDP-N-acetylglucosamine--N-acetylmuramyl-(pentapeptide) pyrophosphoryl-undecaprenol N-acetylglucosamine transferase